MKTTPESDVLKSEKLDLVYADLKSAIVQAVRDKQPVHEIEKSLWQQLQRIGREAMSQIFTLL